MRGLEASNVDAFMNSIWSTDCNIGIGVNLDNGKRTAVSMLEFGAGTGCFLDVDMVSNLPIFGNAFAVGVQEASIDLALANALQRDQICNKRQVQKHIAMKGKSSRRKVVQ